jgi:hypothetical protein
MPRQLRMLGKCKIPFFLYTFLEKCFLVFSNPFPILPFLKPTIGSVGLSIFLCRSFSLMVDFQSERMGEGPQVY